MKYTNYTVWRFFGEAFTSFNDRVYSIAKTLGVVIVSIQFFVNRAEIKYERHTRR